MAAQEGTSVSLVRIANARFRSDEVEPIGQARLHFMGKRRVGWGIQRDLALGDAVDRACLRLVASLPNAHSSVVDDDGCHLHDSVGDLESVVGKRIQVGRHLSFVV